MRLPLLLVYETDGKLAAALRPLAEQRKWLLREPRQLASCGRLFDRGGNGVLVMRLSRDPERELTALEHLTATHPDAAIVLVANQDQLHWANLAWDLGVRWVLMPPHSRERIGEIVTGLMGAET